MQRETILHMLTAAPNLSPFDVNMAIDAGWQHCIPYTGIDTPQVGELTQDAIFSRGPKGVKRTGLFIGGRDIHLAMDMLRTAEKSMVPPFEVSVMADPSGAFTTAAGMVACVEKRFREASGESLKGKTALVFGGTGPVGSTCAILAENAGAEAVLVSHQSHAKAAEAAETCGQRYGAQLGAADGSDDAKIRELLRGADVVFCAAKAGVQVLNEDHLGVADRVRVLCDVNAVPPAGIAGVGAMDDGEVVEATPLGAVGIGALAVGNVKYQTQQALLQQMLETDQPVYLHYAQALDAARSKA